MSCRKDHWRGRSIGCPSKKEEVGVKSKEYKKGNAVKEYKDATGLNPDYIESLDKLNRTMQVLNWILRFREKIEDMPEPDIIKDYKDCLLHLGYKKVIDHNRQEWTIKVVDKDMQGASWIIGFIEYVDDLINHAIRAKEKIEKRIKQYKKEGLKLKIIQGGKP